MIDEYMKKAEMDYGADAVIVIRKAHHDITKGGLVSEDDSIDIISSIVSAVRSNDKCLVLIQKVNLALQPPFISEAGRLCDVADVMMGKK